MSDATSAEATQWRRSKNQGAHCKVGEIDNALSSQRRRRHTQRV